MKAQNPKFLKVSGTFYGVGYIDLFIILISILLFSEMGLSGIALLIIPIIAVAIRHMISNFITPGLFVFRLSKRKSYGWSHSIKRLNNE